MNVPHIRRQIIRQTTHLFICIINFSCFFRRQFYLRSAHNAQDICVSNVVSFGGKFYEPIYSTNEPPVYSPGHRKRF